MIVGIEGGHENGNLTLGRSFREGKEVFFMI